VWLDPLRKKKIDIPYHLAFLAEDDEGIFGGVLYPRSVVFVLLLQRKEFRTGQIEQLWVVSEPRVILFDVFHEVGLKSDPLALNGKVSFDRLLYHIYYE
jgi:hypothetical protein